LRLSSSSYKRKDVSKCNDTTKKRSRRHKRGRNTAITANTRTIKNQ
jgi:hypothetical protein